MVNTIFDVLENIVDENKIADSRIFNMDETSHTIVQRPEKIIAQKANIRLVPPHHAIHERTYGVTERRSYGSSNADLS